MDSSNGHLHFGSQADRHLLEAQVAKLASRRNLTLVQKTQLSSLCAQKNSLLSPVYKLSDDLLMLLFEIIADGGRDGSFGPVVSHVSSRWRRVALATPRLWSNLVLTLPYNSRTRGKGRVETAIERCGHAVPVFLHAATARHNLFRGNQYWIARLSTSAANMLSELLPRCEEVVLHGAFLDKICLRFASGLRSLDLKFPFVEPQSGYPFETLLDALEGCSNLESVSVHRMGGVRTVRSSPLAVEDRAPKRTVNLPALKRAFFQDHSGQSEHPIHSMIHGLEASLEHLSIIAPFSPALPFPFARIQVTHLNLYLGSLDWTHWFLPPYNSTRFVEHLKSLKAMDITDASEFAPDSPGSNILQLDKLSLKRWSSMTGDGKTLRIGNLLINATELLLEHVNDVIE